MSKDKSSYRQIFKATSLFGGVQMVNIAVGMVRSKFVAVLLGTMGSGVMGLLLTTTSVIQSITGLGLSSSAVRDVSEANHKGDSVQFASVITVLRRWVWFTGLMGMLFVFFFAGWLSRLTFANKDYAWAFRILSVTLLLYDLSSGQNVLLQGMRRLKDMARSNVLGSLLGLVTSVPLYYLYGIKGIVPAILIASLSTLVLSWYYTRKIRFERVKISFKETYFQGLGMARLGFVMMLSLFMVTASSYIVTLFISHSGGISQVGLYRSGWSISNQYVAMIFTAMATDYYPRLASVNKDNLLVQKAANEQAEIALLILGPMLILLTGLIHWFIILFYSKEFLPVAGMVKWNMMGMLFKASSWCIGFIVVAKGDSKLFFITDLFSNIMIVALNIAGYYWFGLDGIGISFVLSYVLYFVIMLVIVRKKYDFAFSSFFWKIFLVQTVLILAAFGASDLGTPYLLYIVVAILFSGSFFFSLNELNKRLDIKSFIKRKYVLKNA
jgi:O-antigen/teichoic acid export membrane protein